MATDELILRGTVRYAGDVGFGSVFRLTVTEAAGPVVSDETVLVTVLVGDVEWAEVFHAHPEPDQVEAAFTPRSDHEEYATASFSGFVDRESRSWDLRGVQATGT